MAARAWVAALALLISAGCACAQDPPEGAEQGVVIIARVVWEGQDLTNAVFRVYADAERKQLVDVFPSGGPDGAGFLALRPGEYYLMAVVDANASGKLDAGDALGWYGVEDLAPSTRPKALKVGPGGPSLLEIPILMTVGEGGGLTPLPGAPRGKGIAAGRLTGFAPGPTFVLLRTGLDGPAGYPAAVAADGAFEVTAPAGDYQLLACGAWTDQGGVAHGPAWRVLRDADPDPVRIAPDGRTDLGEIAAGEPAQIVTGLPALVSGRVTGPPPPDGATVRVELCANQHFTVTVATVKAAADGSFLAAIEPATYYLRAVAGSEIGINPGDMLGFFGVTSLTGEDRPQPLALRADQVVIGVEIPLVARMDDEGNLKAIVADDNAATGEAGE